MPMSSAAPAATATTCPYCGVGCGVLVTPDGQGGASIAGDPAHPANFGKLCSKGSALGETLGVGTRLLHPMMRDAAGRLERVSFEAALDHVARGLARTIEQHGPDSVAFYLSGQLLTEDYYVANKLMKGFIGSANVDTNSRLCMASSVAGHRRAFGADTVPGCYEDLDAADLIVLVGSNAAWCHPVLFQRMLRNKRERGARIVVIDPRQTDTAGEADLFLGLKPGSDTALFCGLLVDLIDSGATDASYIAQHTSGLADALARAREIADGVAATALATGLSEQDVATFFRMFRANRRVVTAYSQGVNQSAQGTDKVNAIINCHLATGRIGRPGLGPLSLTGQPNAMGGREVGGLANQLAAHMNFTPPEIDRVRRFWNAPHIATHEGLKAVPMFEAIADGRIRALWVMGTNPVVSLPRADEVRAALKTLDLFVVSENVLSNDTVNAGAHVLFPAHAWGEKSGTVTNSERRISRQRAFAQAVGEAKPDWWIVGEIAERLGHGRAFAYRSAADIFREHARLSAFENDGARDFDIGALSELTDDEYDTLAPVQWPARAGKKPQVRLFAEGGFFTSDRRGRFVAPEAPRLRDATSEAFPLRLNTGRIRDQWHTMTRTGLSPRLGQHLPEPFVEIHPRDAAAFDIHDGGFARLTTEHGSCVLRVVVTARQQEGTLFAPIHWTGETSATGRVGALVASHTDPFSGQPEAKATPVAIRPHHYARAGFALVRAPMALPQETWWSRVAVHGGFGYLFADNLAPGTWQRWIEEQHDAGAVATYEDAGAGILRAAAFRDDALVACVFTGPAEVAPDWSAVRAVFAQDRIDDDARRLLLSGRSAEGVADQGAIVCACFGVGRNAIGAAICGGARSAEAIGAALKAGTNCGSCIPELKRMIAEQAVPAAQAAE